MEKTDFSRAAGLAGLGLAAGLAGALLMSLSQRAEMAITDRAPSATPTKAVETLASIDLPESDEQALSTPVHLAFGTALGLGLAAMAKLPEPARGGLFFAGAWSAGNALVTGLGLSDPPTKWDAKKLAIDLGHHAVYAAGAAAAFFGLRRLARL
ncbi:hypothetical protein Q4F19_15125 [Sphingomonas sp. BIUV-7]|uniref:DUF1440 domain-containing protein n=1 Tax=Sphingomonas natans TaxID=3063330 RepID=A0ABT8YBL5_9SPHN|nr:hypothetical protein [Sphingomonas sp. BIUV-7]MDO6415721.1 hypothetical protein [Sphingomonas sp. BIUV-7]